MICPFADVPPVIPPVNVGISHEYVVPDGTKLPLPSVGVIVNVSPVQTAVVIFKIVALGCTVIVTLNVAPMHEPVVP